MQIVKTDHKSKKGIYAVSREITSSDDWKEALNIADEMIEWLNKENGSFKGEFQSAYAMAHAQVCDWLEPWKLFVVDKSLIMPASPDPKSKNTTENAYFEAQAIFNAEVIETPDKVTRKVPERKINRGEGGRIDLAVDMVDKEVSNKITVPEACMSFPHRKEKNTERFYRIKVRYWYMKKGILGKKPVKFEGWVSGLKAHIIQHETDHFNSKNIFF